VDLNFSGGALQWDGGALSKKHLKACMEKYFVLVFLGMDFFYYCSAKIKLSGFSGAISNQYNY
jgi:hypothetical protein